MRTFLFCLVCLAGFFRPGFSQPVVSTADPLLPSFSLLLKGDYKATLQGAPLPAERAQQYLALYRVYQGDTASIPVTCDYRLRGNTLTAQPLYPLGPGTVFLCRWRDHASATLQQLTYTSPQQPAQQPVSVTAIYPSADALPANTLLFYVRFSGPMQPDEQAWSKVHIRVDTAGGKDIPFAWRQRSFWMDSSRILVLMIHPGRVKHGIHYAGPLLYPGYQYRIDIDTALKDLSGQPLKASDTRRFYVLPEDQQSPKIVSVSASAPAGSRQPIHLRCSEPMDLAGIMEGVSIRNEKGSLCPVQVRQADKAGTTFDLVPLQAWKAGAYTITCGARVTDLAANTMFRLFEFNDVREQAKDKLEKTYPFRVKPVPASPMGNKQSLNNKSAARKGNTPGL